MRLGIVSDIHCNIEGLKIALERLGQVDELLCAGDMVYQYRFNNEVVELLRERRARIILGNHDSVVLSAGGVRVREAPHVRRENLDFLSAQPLLIDTRVDGKRLIMAHGSPLEPFDRYVLPATPAFKELEQIDADYIVLGHTHRQIAQRAGRALVINPGSAGETRDYGEGRVLSCCVLDTASGEVSFETFANPAALAMPPAAQA